MKRLLFVILILFSGNSQPEELPDSLADYVSAIRPIILELSKELDLEDPLKFPVNGVPFDVTSDGDKLIYHSLHPAIGGVKGDRKKITNVLELNQSLVTCGDKNDWGVFEKGWHYNYKIYDLEKNYYTTLVVKKDVCEFLMETESQTVIRVISEILRDNLPFTTSAGEWIYFNSDDEKVEYIQKTNIDTIEQFKNLPEERQDTTLRYLKMYSMKNICMGKRNKFFFNHGFRVREVFLTADMRVLHDIQFANEDCAKIRQHIIW